MSEALAQKRVITMVPPRLQPLTHRPIEAIARKRVAGYARVSTDSDEQENSYEAQVDYFTEYIQSRDEWEFVKIYTDEERSYLELFCANKSPPSYRQQATSCLF